MLYLSRLHSRPVWQLALRFLPQRVQMCYVLVCLQYNVYEELGYDNVGYIFFSKGDLTSYVNLLDVPT